MENNKLIKRIIIVNESFYFVIILILFFSLVHITYISNFVEFHVTNFK